MNVAWESSDSLVLFNPTYSKDEQSRFQRILELAQEKWPGHLWLSTSGSCVQKWVGLSKQAVLASAEAVNRHLKSDAHDRWVVALPLFHVGGLGIWARAYLSGAKVEDFKQIYPGKWQAQHFYAYVQQTHATLTSLVPTQLHDLVILGKPAPSCLRAVVIGGGALLPQLYEQAVALGWPLLPSYGLTECASQVATAVLESWKESKLPSLQLLTHIQAKEQEQRLCFSGPSLLSAYAYFYAQEVQFIDPKEKGWLTSEDRGRVSEGRVEILGRADAICKIGGENVDVARLEMHLQALRLQSTLAAEVTLIALPDSRLGQTLQLVSTSPNKEDLSTLIQQFQQTVLPFERIRKVYLVPQFPRSSLGKILKQELRLLVKSAIAIDLV